MVDVEPQQDSDVGDLVAWMHRKTSQARRNGVDFERVSWSILCRNASMAKYNGRYDIHVGVVSHAGSGVWTCGRSRGRETGMNTQGGMLLLQNRALREFTTSMMKRRQIARTAIDEVL